MVFITYFKSDGEITAPIIVSQNEQTFDSVFGKRAEEFKSIYDSIIIKLDSEQAEIDFVKELHKNYKVNIKTKQLEKKSNELNIKYV